MHIDHRTPRAEGESNHENNRVLLCPDCNLTKSDSMTLIGLRKVYPRVYGGTVAVCAPVTNAAGLSPRVRGNPVCTPIDHTARGSIPACTGEPTPSSPRALWLQVYPRVYGGTMLPKRGV